MSKAHHHAIPFSSLPCKRKRSELLSHSSLFRSRSALLSSIQCTGVLINNVSFPTFTRGIPRRNASTAQYHTCMYFPNTLGSRCTPVKWFVRGGHISPHLQISLQAVWFGRHSDVKSVSVKNAIIQTLSPSLFYHPTQPSLIAEIVTPRLHFASPSMASGSAPSSSQQRAAPAGAGGEKKTCPLPNIRTK